MLKSNCFPIHCASCLSCLFHLAVLPACTAPQVDMCSMEEVDEIAHRANSIPISCSLKLNMDGLLERIWEMMALVGMLDLHLLVCLPTPCQKLTYGRHHVSLDCV